MFQHVSYDVQHKILLLTVNHTENNLEQCKLQLLILKRLPQAAVTHSVFNKKLIVLMDLIRLLISSLIATSLRNDSRRNESQSTKVSGNACGRGSSFDIPQNSRSAESSCL